MSWGVALRNAVGLGLGGIPSLLNAALYPRVDFNFLSGQLDPRITFTRSSTGTYVNSSGVLSGAAVDAPRFDYNPTTLAPLGLLIEEQRTNLCLYSNDLINIAWVIAANAVITGDAAVAPDGTTTADTITINGSNNGVFQSIACSSSTAYTFSLYVKLGTMAASDYKIAIYDNTNAAFIAADIVPTQTPSSTAWTRITYTFTTPATCVSVRVYCFRNSLSAATSVNVWGMQLEQGAFATSYIPTVAASLTRAADVASVTGANFSSWFNSVEGTLLTTTLALNQTLAPNRYVSTMDDGTTNNIIGAYIDTSLNATSFVVNGGVAVYQEVIATVSNTLPNSIAVTYKANNFMSAANGVLGIPDTSGNVPVVNKITFGNRSDGARPLNGYIRSFKYYPTRLRDSALQALTR